MAKNTKDVEGKKTDEVKPKEILTIAATFQKLAVLPSKSRKGLAEKIVAHLKAKGTTVNIKGHQIVVEKVAQEVSAMVRDIKMFEGKGRGFKIGSWWSKYTISEDNESFKIVLKPTSA